MIANLVWLLILLWVVAILLHHILSSTLRTWWFLRIVKHAPLVVYNGGKYINIHQSPSANPTEKRTTIQCCSISISITLTIQDDPKPQLIDHWVELVFDSFCNVFAGYFFSSLHSYQNRHGHLTCSTALIQWTYHFQKDNHGPCPCCVSKGSTSQLLYFTKPSLKHTSKQHLRTDTSTNSSRPNGTKWHCSFVDPVANAKRSSEATTVRSMAKACWRCEGQHSSNGHSVSFP